MEIIRVKNLSKQFKDGENTMNIFEDVDFVIEKNEFVSITGPSGSGKSTLIYQVGLLDEPTKGEIFIDGEFVGNLSVKEKTNLRLNKFGFVFQDYALLPELVAWEQVAVTLLMRGVAFEDAKKKAIETLARFDLGDRVNAKPGTLSGGEQQRVSIARSIVHEPDILFADEPTANLDNERSRQIIDIFHELHKKGQTILMVTHETNYAEEASRIFTIDNHKIISKKGKSPSK